MPTTEAVVERGLSLQLRTAGADGGEELIGMSEEPLATDVENIEVFPGRRWSKSAVKSVARPLHAQGLGPEYGP